jgi:hypothetical protein
MKSRESTVSVPMIHDRLRELSVGLKDISISDNTTLANNPTTLLEYPMVLPLDPLISRIWLPKAVCQAFERALGLAWDDKEALYYISDAQHEDFLSRNLSFTFTITDLTLAPNASTTEILFPYDIMALNAIHPLTTKPGRYFPIQRTLLDNTAVLGRAFLQGAYIIADWDKRTLNISQANLVESTESRVFSLTPPSNSTFNPNELITSNSSRSPRLSTGEIVGITVLIVAVVAGSIALLLILRKRRRKREEAAKKLMAEEAQRAQEPSSAIDPEAPRAELDGSGRRIFEKDEDGKRVEMDGAGTPLELSSNAITGELVGDNPAAELDGSPVSPENSFTPPEKGGRRFPDVAPQADRTRPEDIVSPLDEAAILEARTAKNPKEPRIGDGITPI